MRSKVRQELDIILDGKLDLLEKFKKITASDIPAQKLVGAQSQREDHSKSMQDCCSTS